MPPYEITLTDCGPGVGWLAVVRAPFGGTELWRIGSHRPTRLEAFDAACEAWDEGTTQNIRDYKAGLEVR